MEGNIISKARGLRKRSTSSERLLWEKLRNKKFMGLKFKRQHPIKFEYEKIGRFNFFIADFYCHQMNLIIELDGPIHEHQKEYDESRDEILEANGLRVLQIKNQELEDINIVLNKMKSVCQS